MIGEKKINWTGIAALVATLVATPGILINTYLDYKSRDIMDLVQKSSHQSMSHAIVDLGEDVDVCLNNIDDLKSELSELRGFIRGRFGRSYKRAMGGKSVITMRSPTSTPELLDDELLEEISTDSRSSRRTPASIDAIMEQVQSTGEVYDTDLD